MALAQMVPGKYLTGRIIDVRATAWQVSQAHGEGELKLWVTMTVAVLRWAKELRRNSGQADRVTTWRRGDGRSVTDKPRDVTRI